MPDNEPLYIIGAGGHAKVVANAALEAGLNLVGFLSDLAEDEGRTVLGLPVLLRQEHMSKSAHYHIAIGSNSVRAKLARDMTFQNWTAKTITHPSAVIARDVVIGFGCFIGPQSVVHPGANLANNVIVNSATVVEHDCIIEENVHLSPRVVLGGHVTIGQKSWIGIGATVRDRICIGANMVIGAGSVVVSDIAGPGTAYGVPAKLKNERI